MKTGGNVWMIVTGIIMLLPIIYGITKKDMLPEKIATHFDKEGTPNGWSTRNTVIFGLPVFMTVLQAVLYIVLILCKVDQVSAVLMAILMVIMPVVEYVSLYTIYKRALKK